MPWQIFYCLPSIRNLTAWKVVIVVLVLGIQVPGVLLPMTKAVFADESENLAKVLATVSSYGVRPPYRRHYVPLGYGYLPYRYPDSPYPGIRAAIKGEAAPRLNCRFGPRIFLEPFGYRYLPFGLGLGLSFIRMPPAWGGDIPTSVKIFQGDGGSIPYGPLRTAPANSYCDGRMLSVMPE